MRTNKQLKPEQLRVKKMLERMSKAYQVDNKTLAEKFGYQPNTLNNWVHYARVPYEQMEQCAKATNTTMDWLVFGKPAQVQLSIEQQRVIKRTTTKVLEDSIDYNIIQELQPNGITTITTKLHKELINSLNEPTDQLKLQHSTG